MPYQDHESYFATIQTDIRSRLELIQTEVELRVPGATRCIGYNMPAFRQRSVFFYFAAFKKHIGVYPPLTGNQALLAETAGFRGPKGNLSFPHNRELPLALIGRVAAALAAQYSRR
jgi:uncharacterized protein YdhG (YjbR/CyaY superfamily)